MTNPRPFRFGIQYPGLLPVQDRASFVDYVRRIEDLGFSTFQVPDHFFVPLLAPVPVLMATAMATTRLRVGTLVLDQDFRHPAMVAKEAMTIDLLSDGRLELGLGAGWMRQEYAQLGIPFDAPGVRVSRLAEYVRAVKALLTRDDVSLQGEHVHISGLTNAPRPTQRPHPPILLAGGQKRILSLAAREADIVGLATGPSDAGQSPSEALDERLGWVREAAGERFASLELQTVVNTPVALGLERQEAARQAAEQLRQRPAPGLGSPSEAELLASPGVLLGTVEQVVEQLQACRERFGISYFTYFLPHGHTAETIQTFGRVVARLAGT